LHQLPVDHGIAQDDIDRALELGTQFFNLPEDVKLKSQFDPDTYLGYDGSPTNRKLS
jgi:isopenicillin N synthase-like dioxygenase